MDNIKAREITQQQLIRAFVEAAKYQKNSIRFGFILGAGASRNSNIPDGVSLSKKWYEQIKEDISPDELKMWSHEINLQENDLASKYTKIFEKRFEANRQVGYQELQSYMDLARPSIGYSFLAQILDETNNKFVITTNFDTMTEDALFEFRKSKPLVLGHELLSKYINPVSPSRPTIVKVHRDFLFDPYNTDQEIKKLDEHWQDALKPILLENNMIVLGYAGNDDSLMNYLEKTEDKKPLYWCFVGNKNNLSEKITKLLTEKDFIIKIDGFDELMLNINDSLNFPPYIDIKNIEESQIVKDAKLYAKRYKNQIEQFSGKLKGSDNKEAIKKLLPSWWAYQLEVNDKQGDSIEQNNIYLEGIAKYPTSYELISNYAIFLQMSKKDYHKAEKYYKKALELAPNEATVNENYALFLRTIIKDYDEAEKYYKKALELDPVNANNIGNYALFLHEIRKDYDEAEKYHKKALELDPTNAINNGNYALFLHEIKKDYDEAEKYYKKAIEFDPTNANNIGNYALFLHEIRKDYDEAEKYYKKALELDPTNAINNGNYALFLRNVLKDYNEAEKYHKKALELDPTNAINNGNYALFLSRVEEDYDEAEKYHKKALELDPTNAINNGNYALFLHEIKKDYDEAEKYYKIALKLDPKNSNILGTYAIFLNTIKKDYNEAEKYYKKALEVDQNHANNNGNYAQFLLQHDRKKEAVKYLDNAFANQTEDNELIIELWFYKLAHFPESNLVAKETIDELLKRGIKSVGWDFDENIKQAEKEGVVDIDVLKAYARLITE
ncbi:tetratricopeptide repeat protein [Sulfurimonas sp. HSL3-2]|uniref:tetratricopeptide repeat protein n=1 Tax=Hydrocurvibacter mobilis TaxID=3131936 RepID=UPI0031F9437F